LLISLARTDRHGRDREEALASQIIRLVSPQTNNKSGGENLAIAILYWFMAIAMLLLIWKFSFQTFQAFLTSSICASGTLVYLCKFSTHSFQRGLRGPRILKLEVAYISIELIHSIDNSSDSTILSISGLFPSLEFCINGKSLPLEINTSVGARGRIIRENFASDNIMRSLGNIFRFTGLQPQLSRPFCK